MTTQLRGELNAEEAYRALIDNEYDWYVVEYDDGSYDLTHSTGLSSILECGADPEEYGIYQLHQCWGGQELGESPF